jgi:hypothetical protein
MYVNNNIFICILYIVAFSYCKIYLLTIIKYQQYIEQYIEVQYIVSNCLATTNNILNIF